MDTMGSPSWDERLSMVRSLVMRRLLAFLDPPEGLRVTAKKGTPEYQDQDARQMAFWNELGQAVARELPAGANREEIGNMLTEAVNECVASRNYRVWPGIGEIATPLRQLAKDWHERQRANSASVRSLPAPKLDPLADFRDQGWTADLARQWVERLSRDHAHPFRDSLLAMAKAALERCEARDAGETDPEALQHQRRHYFGGPDPREAERHRGGGDRAA